LASGVPVVEPAHGAFPEILQRTEGGLLAKSEQPGDVADAIMQLWRDPAGAAAMGARGAAGVRRAYTIEQMTDRMLDVYRDARGAAAH
jgi:glycosyltransferase involved in cell wall biosynthesis